MNDDIAQVVLSKMYSKLREEESFSCDCSMVVNSIGYNPYDVRFSIFDECYTSGLSTCGYIYTV